MSRTFSQCEICNDIADRGFESGPAGLTEIAHKFLAHVIQSQTDELMALRGETCLPIFVSKRALR